MPRQRFRPSLIWHHSPNFECCTWTLWSWRSMTSLPKRSATVTSKCRPKPARPTTRNQCKSDREQLEKTRKPKRKEQARHGFITTVKYQNSWQRPPDFWDWIAFANGKNHKRSGKSTPLSLSSVVRIPFLTCLHLVSFDSKISPEREVYVAFGCPFTRRVDNGQRRATNGHSTGVFD